MHLIIIFFFRPEVIIIDLTIPWDGRVDAARSEKLAKFSQLVAAIKENQAFNVTYQSLEIGSFRQRLSDGSESAMKLLYNYITPKMTFDAFRCNLIDLVNYSSYHVSIVSQNTASMAKSDDFDNYDKLEIDGQSGFPQLLKFVYSERATNFCEISILLLSTVHTDKSEVEISQNFVAFSEYMNFINKKNIFL